MSYFLRRRREFAGISHGITKTQQNSNLWLNNVELRDNGVITIGTVFRIICLLPVTNYLRGEIPLIESHHPVIILQQPKSYNTIIPSDNLQGKSSQVFALNGAFLSCTAYSCKKTKCGGSFCDRQRLNEWNAPVGTCGCYAQRTRGTNNLRRTKNRNFKFEKIKEIKIYTCVYRKIPRLET